jgi:HSP20 family protein
MFERLDRMFDDWTRILPLGRPVLFGRWLGADLIHVDEFRDNGALVIRAELPGVDPDKDVKLTVADGMLTIEAERHEDKKVEDKGYLCRELRYGSLIRTLPLPMKVSEADITASYKDGMLEVRVPAPKEVAATTVPISKA